ncbi:DUF4235 domain-containing protein [Demequina sp. NBRC 110053]|uniref:DUF4235 domain-containing protein n=1 Tax=Demequina sp. NBRC 110053 TaxID=1570342 RepID=UPI0009FBF0D2|nr:DUF4235 domain-containing protein [Demequina sp. NBRC 110053]
MSRSQKSSSTSAALLYRPIGLAGSMLAGFITSKVFDQVWKRASASKDADPPGPLQSEYPMKEIVAAAALQGAIFAVVRTLVQRGGARLYERATGNWPGS